LKLDHGSAALKIEASDSFESAGFNIRASAIAFNVLSSGLYQDKIAAVIRELSTNAYDGHMLAELGVKDAAGNWVVRPIPNRTKLPFKIQLPSSWDPVFVVRDYGVGLDHDGIMKLYTTYFGSTKSDSNDFVGALGLGSKSPFSLASSFLVASFYNGIKRTYTAMIGEDGFPTIVKMGEEATKEDNGLEVRVTVDPTQIQMFRDRAQKIYSFFKVKPQIPSLTISSPEYSKQTAKWGIRGNRYQTMPTGVIMGQICYPITLSALEGKVKPHIYKLLQQYQGQIDFFCELGEVEFQASREALSYTQKTFDFFDEALESFYDEIKAAGIATLASAKTYIDKVLMLRKMDNLTRLVLEQEIKNGLLTYKGRPFNFNTNMITSNTKLTDLMVVTGDLTGKDPKDPPRARPKFRVMDSYGQGTQSDIWNRGVDFAQNTIEYGFPIPMYGDMPRIIWNDAGVALYRLRDYLYNTGRKKADRIYLVDKKHPEVAEFIKNTYELTEIEKTSSWAIQAVNVDQIKKITRLMSPSTNVGSISNAFERIDSAKDLEGVRYYVCTSGNAHTFEDPLDLTRTVDSSELNENLCALYKFGFLKNTEQLAVIAKTNLAAFKELMPDVKCASEMIKDRPWDKIPADQKKEISALVFRSKIKDNNRYRSGFQELIAEYTHFLDHVAAGRQFPQELRNWAGNEKREYVNLAQVVYDKLRRKEGETTSPNLVKWLESQYTGRLIDFQSDIDKTATIEERIKTVFPVFGLLKKLYYRNTSYRYYNFDNEVVEVLDNILINDMASIKAKLNI
jgi:hypothetical protein